MILREYVPAALAPRLSTVGLGMLAAGLVLGEFGELFGLRAWLQDASPFCTAFFSEKPSVFPPKSRLAQLKNRKGPGPWETGPQQHLSTRQVRKSFQCARSFNVTPGASRHANGDNADNKMEQSIGRVPNPCAHFERSGMGRIFKPAEPSYATRPRSRASVFHFWVERSASCCTSPPTIVVRF